VAAAISDQKHSPLFRTFKGKGKGQVMTLNRLNRKEAWSMIQRRARQAGIREQISPHSFRGTGITVYLDSGGSLEHAQQIANHESAKTTKLYDHTNDAISLDEIERIQL
jgi:integrase